MAFLVSNVSSLSTILDLIIIFLAIVISYQSGRIYKFIGKNSYKYFSLAFLSIGFGYLFKILANFTLVYRVYLVDLNIITVILREYSFMQIVHFISFFLHQSFTMFGLMILFLVTKKIKSRGEIFIFAYAGLLAVIFSLYIGWVYHLTMFFLSFLLADYYYMRYKKSKSPGGLLVFIAFLLICVGTLICLFPAYPYDCLIEEIFYVLGFLVLSINHFGFHNVKKKIKAGDN